MKCLFKNVVFYDFTLKENEQNTKKELYIDSSIGKLKQGNY